MKTRTNRSWKWSCKHPCHLMEGLRVLSPWCHGPAGTMVIDQRLHLMILEVFTTLMILGSVKSGIICGLIRWKQRWTLRNWLPQASWFMVCQNQKESLGWFLPVSILLWFIWAWEQANPWLWHTSSCLINCLLRHLWWPCFNQRYRWLFALHLSWYCLAILPLPFVTSRNHDMNLTFLIPPRGSALPQSSPWHPVSQGLAKCCFWGLNLSNSPPSPPVTPTCTKCQQKEPGSARAAQGRHKTGNPEGQN